MSCLCGIGLPPKLAGMASALAGLPNDRMSTPADKAKGGSIRFTDSYCSTSRIEDGQSGGVRRARRVYSAFGSHAKDTSSLWLWLRSANLGCQYEYVY